MQPYSRAAAAALLVAASVVVLYVSLDARGASTLEVVAPAVVNSAKKISDFMESFTEEVSIHVKCGNSSVFLASYVDPGLCEKGMDFTFSNHGGSKGMVKGKLYTMAVVDPDWPKPDDPNTDAKENSMSQRLLQMVINIPGDTKDVSKGESVQEYIGPNHKKCLCDGDHKGEHRVVVILFEQMPPFEVVDYLTAPRTHFNIQDMLVQRVKQKPIGDFFFYTKCGGYKGTAKGKPGYLPPV